MRLLIVFLIFSFSASASIVELEYANAKLLYEKGEYDSANFVFNRLLLNQLVDDSLKGQIAFSIGGFYRSRFDYKLAENYLNRALNYTDLTKPAILTIDVNNELGLVYFDQHQFTRALSYFSVSLQLANELEDTIGGTMVLINIGNVFKETHDYDNALSYYSKALENVKQSKDSQFKAIILIDIGSVLYLQKQPKKALEVMKEAVVLVTKKEDWLNLAHLQTNMGLCYTDLKDHNQAKIQFEQALKLYTDFENQEGIYLCYVNLFLLAQKLDDRNDLTAYLNKANNPKFDSCNLQAQIDFAIYKKAYFIEIGDTINAFSAANKLIDLQHEFFEDFQNAQLNQLKLDLHFSEVKAQLTDTEEDLEIVRKEKELVHDLNEKLKNQNAWIIFLSLLGLLFFIAFLLIMIRSNRRKRRLNNKLVEQKLEVEKKNEEILNSMVYANSMEKLLLQQMNPHFLYNALMTVDASITVGDTDFAKKYLNLFSDLLRKTLDNSRMDAISLEQEIDFLKAYIKLNAVKQGDHFNCQFIYEEDDVADFVFTPPMLVQPFIENALVHGLYHKTSGLKQLTIQIQPKQNYILWIITDNGVGRAKSKEIGKTHKVISHGIKITVDRIYWMKKRYANDFSVEYVDLEQGTEVRLKTPILDNIVG